MQTILDAILFAAGFCTGWLCKDTLLRFLTGTEVQVRSLEAKLAALRAML